MNLKVWKLNAKLDRNKFNLTILAMILTFLIVSSTTVNAQLSVLINRGLSNNTRQSPLDKLTFTHSYNPFLDETSFSILSKNGMNETSNANRSYEQLNETNNSHSITFSVDKNTTTIRNDTKTMAMKVDHLSRAPLMVTLKGENISIFFGPPNNNNNNNHFSE
jgi:hypothetical protein